MINKNFLPYFKIINKPDYTAIYKFLRRKFLPSVRKIYPHHYLITQYHRLYLNFIQQIIKTHPYFLRLDINKYFPSINHQILLSEIESNYRRLADKPLSRRFKYLLKNGLPQFLNLSPYPNQGLPLGSGLSHILAGIYLLRLDLKLNIPFLRFCDDYLIFAKGRNQIEQILKNIINPVLSELNLSVNIPKSKSGKFHQDKVSFIGFEFYAGYFRIKPEKIEEFKKKIIKITHLTKKKPEQAIIKQLNNKILGFGHYYKFAQTKQIFEELDALIRARLRRYIQRNKDSKDKQMNLVLTNVALQSMGLKSLEEIYQKYSQENQCKFKKKKKIKIKTGKSIGNLAKLDLKEIEAKYGQKLILNQLKELTSLVKRLERRLSKLERKLVKDKVSK